MVGSRISVAVILYHNIFQCLLGQSLLNILTKLNFGGM